MLCEPMESEVVNEAIPELFSVALARTRGGLVSVSLNCTIPVGTIEPEEGDTIAVNVTGVPNVDGFCDEISVVDVLMIAKADTSPIVSSEHDNKIQRGEILDIFTRRYFQIISYKIQEEIISKNS